MGLSIGRFHRYHAANRRRDPWLLHDRGKQPHNAAEAEVRLEYAIRLVAQRLKLRVSDRAAPGGSRASLFPIRSCQRPNLLKERVPVASSPRLDIGVQERMLSDEFDHGLARNRLRRTRRRA